MYDVAQLIDASILCGARNLLCSTTYLLAVFKSTIEPISTNTNTTQRTADNPVRFPATSVTHGDESTS